VHRDVGHRRPFWDGERGPGSEPLELLLDLRLAEAPLGLRLPGVGAGRGLASTTLVGRLRPAWPRLRGEARVVLEELVDRFVDRLPVDLAVLVDIEVVEVEQTGREVRARELPGGSGFDASLEDRPVGPFRRCLVGFAPSVLDDLGGIGVVVLLAFLELGELRLRSIGAFLLGARTAIGGLACADASRAAVRSFFRIAFTASGSFSSSTAPQRRALRVARR
jgi:hypothetical protein